MTQTVRSYQSWSAINATPADPDFNLDAGVYGLTARATVWGSVTLQRVFPGAILVAVAPILVADGYVVLQLPAGKYRATLAGITALTGALELIAPGSG